MGRIYDLEDSLDKFIDDERFQVEFIGESGCWTYRVNSRKWDSILQRYVYEYLGGGTCPEFLTAYDFIARRISSNSK